MAASTTVAVDDVIAVIPVDAASAQLMQQLDAAAAAVVATQDLSDTLCARYDELDFTPARVGSRLRTAQFGTDGDQLPPS